jgi:hypothetical protein
MSKASAQEWKDKFELYEYVLGVESRRSVVYLIYPKKEFEEQAESIYANVCQWCRGNGTPSYAEGVMDFLDALSARLELPNGAEGSFLIKAGIDKTIDLLPEPFKQKGIIWRQLKSGQITESSSTSVSGTVPPMVDSEDMSVIWLEHSGKIQTIAQGFAQGRVDQKHYYLDPHSSEEWTKIIDAQSYPTYDHCLLSFRNLLESSAWNECVRQRSISTSVMLAGGGAPAKDLLMLRSLLSQEYARDPIHHYLIDISLYMLRYSAMWLCGNDAVLRKFNKRVVLKPTHRDVLSLTQRDGDRFHRSGAVVFAITGGTLGNISETALFGSLDQMVRDSDLLIVSADTIDDLTREEQEKLVQKYDSPDLRAWLKPVVKNLLSECEEHESVDHALGKIKVKLRFNDEKHISSTSEKRISDVEDSCAVVVTLTIGGKEIILLSSARYQTPQLVKFAAKHGWQTVTQCASEQNPRFKQFLFKRN